MVVLSGLGVCCPYPDPTGVAGMTATVPITRLLRSAWPQHTAKHAARASGLSVRTAQAWLSERCTPSAATLLLMAHHNETLRRELIARLESHTHEEARQMVLPLEGAPLSPARDEPGTQGGVVESVGRVGRVTP
jgi:hypothetical protein